ncbi:hypothetical protein IQ251_12670 [Saccharopolyspora sp. HNM0983]|uniref:SMODS-associated and fused to various effectors domain-containing protein n=1 Tax=Saccharopolyspora montiporae TaxID=2781240 RepID=A0A929BC13_9PSEU|nr:hypothetical protein [Saccharopolyspora sp. HNM0983]MBE9375298.1 hypothetical protein [Saccharopolyspora sp. HNM0983]
MRFLRSVWRSVGGYVRVLRQRPVIAADFAIVVCAAVITACLSLLVEDVLPAEGDARQFVLSRWLVFGGAFLALLVFLIVRSRLRETRGTLFYVQVLDEGMRNTHHDAVRAATRTRMGTRSLTRWVDMRTTADDSVLDLVETSEAVGRDLEDAINSDREDTGYALASNLFWFMGLSVGAALPHDKGIVLVELLPQPKRPAANGETPAGNRITRRLRRKRRRGSESVPTETSFPLESGEGTGAIQRAEKPLANPTGDRVGIWVALTKAAGKFSVDKFEQFGVSTVHQVTYNGVLPGLDAPAPDYSAADMSLMGRDIAEALAAIKTDSGDRELVVVAMMPKAVALSAGWHLAQRAVPFFRGTYLMHCDTVHRNAEYVPARVRASQPTGVPSRMHAAHRESEPGAAVVNGEV